MSSYTEGAEAFGPLAYNGPMRGALAPEYTFIFWMCHPENPRIGGPVNDASRLWGKRVEGSAFRALSISKEMGAPGPSLLGTRESNEPIPTFRI